MKQIDVYPLLRKKFPEREYALMQEVRDKAGFNASNSADYVLMNLWPSRGLHLSGIEVKKSRSDWLRELKRPDKAENIFQYCDYFWLFTTDETIATLEEIPDNWGWMNVKGKRIYTLKEAPKQNPKPITSSFLAALLKRACNKDGFIRQSEIQETIDKAVEYEKQHKDYRTKQLTDENKKLNSILIDYQNASGIDLKQARWRHNTTNIGQAVKFVQNGGVEKMEERLLSLENTAKIIHSQIADQLQDIKSKTEFE